ncbi:hypothetical protein NPIL_258531, partial [Nephila pilipes]
LKRDDLEGYVMQEGYRFFFEGVLDVVADELKFYSFLRFDAKRNFERTSVLEFQILFTGVVTFRKKKALNAALLFLT